MSDQEPDFDSDHEVSKEHSKLLNAVAKLDKGQRVKKPERSEPTLEVSEFHLVKSGVTDKDAVRVDDLVKTLKGKGHHREINKKFKESKKLVKVLPKPLEKPAAEKLKRQTGFYYTKKELQKWDAIVTRNRTAEKLVFPLNQPSFKTQSTKQFVKRFRVQSDLEKELAELDPPKPEPEEKKDDFPMTLAEIQEKRKETAKFRAQQSYQAAKALRQNKIKSKKFHRIQRKAKIKEQLKEFEKLQKTDPEKALEMMQQLDKTRAEERMSLRHKSTGQWAKNRLVRAKYDKDTRQELAQQLSISRELTQKIRKEESDEEEDDEGNENTAQIADNDKDNPWSKKIKTDSEIDNFISSYKKFWEEKNKDQVKEVGENVEPENTFPVPEIILPESMNPVEAVIEEDPVAKTNGMRNKKMAVMKIKKNFPKVEKKKSGTSEWNVEIVGDDESVPDSKFDKSIDINEIFDNMEDKLKKKTRKKLTKTRRKLQQAAGHYKNDKNEDLENHSDQDYSDLSFKRTKLRPELDEAMDETTGKSNAGSVNKDLTSQKNIALNGTASAKKSVKRQSTEIDPTKFFAVKPKHLKTMLPDDVTGGDEGLDDSEDDEDVRKDQLNIISEAFAGDDVVDEFAKDKKEEIEKAQPEDINMVLPGWGSWTGKNIKVPKRKKCRFILKFPKEEARRDENKGDVIIIEGGNPKIREHQVSDLPYPFESVAEFEASIRAPIGRNFVPENAHKQLIEPAVITKMGQIIEPMDEEVLLQKDNKMNGFVAKKKEMKEIERAAKKKVVKKVKGVQKKTKRVK